MEILVGLIAVVVGAILWSVVDCALRPPEDFTAAGRRKERWLVLLLVAWIAGIGVVISFVYLVRVRPAVSRAERRRGTRARLLAEGIPDAGAGSQGSSPPPARWWTPVAIAAAVVGVAVGFGVAARSGVGDTSEAVPEVRETGLLLATTSTTPASVPRVVTTLPSIVPVGLSAEQRRELRSSCELSMLQVNRPVAPCLEFVELIDGEMIKEGCTYREATAYLSAMIAWLRSGAAEVPDRLRGGSC